MSAKRPITCEDIGETVSLEAKKQKTIDSYYNKNVQDSAETPENKDWHNDFKVPENIPEDSKCEIDGKIATEDSTDRTESVCGNSKNTGNNAHDSGDQIQEADTPKKAVDEKTVPSQGNVHSNALLDREISCTNVNQNEVIEDKLNCSIKSDPEINNIESKCKEDKYILEQTESKNKEDKHASSKYTESTKNEGEHKLKQTESENKEDKHTSEHTESKNKDDHRLKHTESKSKGDKHRTSENYTESKIKDEHRSTCSESKHKKYTKENPSPDRRNMSPKSKGHMNSQHGRSIPKDEKFSSESPNRKLDNKDRSRDQDSEAAHGSKSPEKKSRSFRNSNRLDEEKKSGKHKRDSSEDDSTPRKRKITRMFDSPESEAAKDSTPSPHKKDRLDEEKKSDKRKRDSSEDDSTPHKRKITRLYDSSEGEASKDSTPSPKKKDTQYKKQQSQMPGFEFFYGMKSPFSQFHPARFEKDGILYNCAEQYMMYQKAVVFNDMEHGEKILQETKPLKQKRLGRKVRGFDPVVWREKCIDVVKEGNIAKFSQNPHLKKQLFDTYPKIMAESSPRDCLWGIGMSPSNPKAWNEKTWRGKNLLGYALMEVRSFLMEKEGLI